MGAAELLRHLRGAGFHLKLTPAGGVYVGPRSALTDSHRSAIRAERNALVLALRAEGLPQPSLLLQRSGDPLLTPEQGDNCNAAGRDDTETHVYRARKERFTRMGRAADAGYLAERLTLRDRQYDDRRMCVECTALAEDGRCLAAASGSLPGASRELEPVQAILQRCESFSVALGLG